MIEWIKNIDRLSYNWKEQARPTKRNLIITGLLNRFKINLTLEPERSILYFDSVSASFNVSYLPYLKHLRIWNAIYYSLNFENFAKEIKLKNQPN